MKRDFFGKLSLLTRSLFGLSSGLLLLGFAFPLWQISLWAPQYPEGLNLFIWINKFSGDVQTVNILNHYIGMAPITEAKFPELLLFPKLFISLSIFSLVVAIVGRKSLSYLFTISLVAVAIWALLDFYNWEYRFGHELNPDAAIKMEDMVYQPPLIGEKVFLNISASSWPGIAGYAFAFSVLAAVFSFIYEVLRGEEKSKP